MLSLVLTKIYIHIDFEDETFLLLLCLSLGIAFLVLLQTQYDTCFPNASEVLFFLLKMLPFCSTGILLSLGVLNVFSTSISIFNFEILSLPCHLFATLHNLGKI